KEGYPSCVQAIQTYCGGQDEFAVSIRLGLEPGDGEENICPGIFIISCFDYCSTGPVLCPFFPPKVGRGESLKKRTPEAQGINIGR
ncbi:MAG TPA: hypothetical protein VFQ43_08570, partial [Nitrososphaera sp.]|nr:hypothetical protein [Nitrososphaera sp.]